MALLNEGGRPSTYDPQFCDEADVYIANCQDDWEEFHKTRGDKSDTYERSLVVKLPSYEGFCMHLGGVGYQTVIDWAKVHPDFEAALSRIKMAQKKRLMEKGVAGTYNSTIAKLILSANHGMHEKNETDVNVKLPQPILDTTDPSEDVPANDSNTQDSPAA